MENCPNGIERSCDHTAASCTQHFHTPQVPRELAAPRRPYSVRLMKRAKNLTSVVLIWLGMSTCGCRLFQEDRSPRASLLTEEYWQQAATASSRLLEASFSNSVPETRLPVWSTPEDDLDRYAPFELSYLVSQVLDSNSDLAAAEAAWQAALETRAIVTSFEDPQFRFLNGPTIFGNNSGAFLWRLQAQQHVPWYGKRELRGLVADSTAQGAHQELKVVKKKLAQLATEAFYGYALAESIHQLAMEDQRLALLERRQQQIEQVDTKSDAWASSAEELELEELEVKRVYAELNQARNAARRRVNLMMKRASDAPLPPPMLPVVSEEIPEAAVLIHQALSRRPDIAVARANEQKARTEVELAYKDFFPDVYVVGRFDTNGNEFWLPEQLNIRPQIGLNVYAPVQQGRRWAQVRRSEANLLKARFQSRSLEQKIHTEIHELLEDLKESNQKLDSMHRLVAAAERRYGPLDEPIMLTSGEEAAKRISGKRRVVKYRMELTQARLNYHQKILSLQGLTGGDAVPPSYTYQIPKLQDSEILPLDQFDDPGRVFLSESPDALGDVIESSPQLFEPLEAVPLDQPVQPMTEPETTPTTPQDFPPTVAPEASPAESSGPRRFPSDADLQVPSDTGAVLIQDYLK